MSGVSMKTVDDGKSRASVLRQADAHHGKSEKDKAEVAQWLEDIAKGNVVKPENFKVC